MRRKEKRLGMNSRLRYPLMDGCDLGIKKESWRGGAVLGVRNLGKHTSHEGEEHDGAGSSVNGGL